jgi:glutaminyl-tRNA synthetase
MANPNMKMRDPMLYRIKFASHYRAGDAWCIYPMYDFTHCLSDSLEDITHSICTLEFENNRELYDWVIDHSAVKSRPKQFEFARLNLTYTVMSKRKLLKLVNEGHVSGWDDPRMPSLAGHRRRGVPPSAIRAFCERVGVAKNNSIVDVALFEHTVRDDLNAKAPRVLCVTQPLKVVINNYPEGQTEQLHSESFPNDVAAQGSRDVPFGRELYIERADFSEEPAAGFKRLAPGREVRLRHAYFIKCESVVKDDAGRIVELRCSYDPATRGGKSPDGRKVKGTIHWVSAEHGIPVELRIYDRLFSAEFPGEDGVDFVTQLNPNSLQVLNGVIEPSVADVGVGDAFQFERQGYFCLDPDSTPDHRVFNRIVPLKDSWSKVAKAPVHADPEPEAKNRDNQARIRPSRAARTIVLDEARAARYRDVLALSEKQVQVLAGDDALGNFYDQAHAAGAKASTLATWIVNELQRDLKARTIADLPFGPVQMAELIGLIDDGSITGTAGKEVLSQMLSSGESPAKIVNDRGLSQISDSDTLGAVVQRVLDNHADEAARFRAGEERLIGFFVGQVMRRTGGAANPGLVQKILREKLS